MKEAIEKIINTNCPNCTGILILDRGKNYYCCSFCPYKIRKSSYQRIRAGQSVQNKSLRHKSEEEKYWENEDNF